MAVAIHRPRLSALNPQQNALLAPHVKSISIHCPFDNIETHVALN